MRRLLSWHRRLRNLVRRDGLEREMDDEMRFHLEQEIAERIAGGMTREEATRAAHAAFGNVPLLRDEARDAWGWSWLDDLRRDVRLAVRMLGRNPAFTLTAIVTLALGIGANTAMFNLTNLLLLRPLYDSPDEVVGVYSRDTTPPSVAYRRFSYPDYRDLRDRSRSFASLSAFRESMVALDEGGSTHRALAFVVSSNYFETFRRPPSLGRPFTMEEERPGADARVAIVSHQYWRRTGADANVVGRTIRINGSPFTIVGVSAEGFTGHMILGPEVWVPLGAYDIVDAPEPLERTIGSPNETPAQPFGDRADFRLLIAGRLAPGVSAEAADAELMTLARQFQDAFPASHATQTLHTAQLSRTSLGTAPARPDPGDAVLAMLLTGTALVVLLVACLNLAGLLLARGRARRREMAVRLSLGGGRRRLVRQLMTEGLVLALAGGAAGLLVSGWATAGLIGSLGPVLPASASVATPHVDWRVVLATAGFCVAAVLFFAAGPAWALTRPSTLAHLRQQSGTEDHSTGGPFRTGRGLVVVQVALSVALLSAGGLFLMSALAASRADIGFPLAGGVLVEIDPGLAGYDEARGRETHRTVLDRVRGLPGVEAASLASLVPLTSLQDEQVVVPAGATAEESRIIARYSVIGNDYFRALGLPLLQGRDFVDAELIPGEPGRVAMVDETLARRLWPGEEALGRQIQFVTGPKGEMGPVMQIVAIVPPVTHRLLEQPPMPHVYVPLGQDYQGAMTLHVRSRDTSREAEVAVLEAAAAAVQALDPRVPILSRRTWLDHREASQDVWGQRTGARVFLTFAGAALLLTIIGVYGVKAYLVARRTREFGVRVAVGARPRDVLWLVLKEGSGVTAIGIAAGVLLALGIGTLLQNLLFGVGAVEPVVLIVAPLVLAAASLFASYVPARRATNVDPMVALRTE